MTLPPRSAGLTEELARLAVDWVHPDSDGSRELAERAVVDTVGVALAATQDATVTASFDAFGPDLRGGPATAWTRAGSGDARGVALLNGTSAHALDFDDVDDDLIGHPSAVLVPTVLALGEEQGSSGPEVLDAYWAGLAVCRALADALDIDHHYGAGWHSTGTIGAVGAAAAGVRLHGLDIDRARNALGIAGSLAAGSRQNFGTMTKPLHAGVASANGILAAKLAAAGFTADRSQLEGPLGYLALHAAAPGSRAIRLDRLASAGLNVKLHACCYYIHAAADAMLDLAAGGLTAREVSRVVVTCPADGLGVLIHHRPSTGLQGKFSMEYAMAASLLDRSLDLSVFTDDAVNRTEARRLIEMVELVASETPPVGPPTWDWGYAVVSVETRDGGWSTRRVDKPRGHASRPVEEADLRRKFDDCLRQGGHQPNDELFERLRGMRSVSSVREVTALISTSSGLSSEGAPAPLAGVAGAVRR